MVNQKIKANANHLRKELDWFSKVLDERFKKYFEPQHHAPDAPEIKPPVYPKKSSLYAGFIDYYNLNIAERIVLVLALIPHIQPHLLDVFFSRNEKFNRGFTEFGGIKGEYHGGFLPTGETAMFILAGYDIEKRITYSPIFGRDHFFYKHKILQLHQANENEPYLSGVLQLSDEYVDYFTSGKIKRPKFSLSFPAKPIKTNLEWDDLILDETTLAQIKEILTWIEHGDTLMQKWGMNKRIMPGFRCLFHGPSGTGKTLTAGLIGKLVNKEVYKIDLSMVISKYIGETEKNLAKVFDKAENKGWILFFDEADALFGKRTSISDSHDRYANQEVSYLLQKVEDYNGLVILATNFKSNLDEAFTRRFQSIIHFPMPKSAERLKLWKNAISSEASLDKDINLNQIANKYEIAGGSIMNIIRYVSLMAIRNGDNIIRNKDLQEGIVREFRKEGKTF
jgi:AAA+ superfamily predicted ATPase